MAQVHSYAPRTGQELANVFPDGSQANAVAFAYPLVIAQLAFQDGRDAVLLYRCGLPEPNRFQLAH